MADQTEDADDPAPPAATAGAGDEGMTAGAAPNGTETTGTPKSGERIAKLLSRAGVASRRDAERMIAAGRVAVNGRIIASPALDVSASDRITVDGQPLPAAEPARLWLYHKPAGLVTTARDEKGRPTIHDGLPPDLPRVMPIGRLDLTSEGLLLLTNDGGLKRRLELPSTGWLRKYRVRVNGTPLDATLEPLRRGIVIAGERFAAMTVTLDRQQGANAWLTVALREGRNREVRRAMEAVGLTVNRLIRISYGPFRLGDLPPGAVEEVRQKVLREQLGLEKPAAGEAGDRHRAAERKTSAARADKAGPGRMDAGTSGAGRKTADRKASGKTGSAGPGRRKSGVASKAADGKGKAGTAPPGRPGRTGPKPDRRPPRPGKT